jgi:FlaA1/EpsC-like NDP-sugar epimerase
VRDAARLRALFERYRPHDVFHAAARKHVPLMETAPCEAVKTNVLGTWNVAEAAQTHGAERFVLMSTDKAVRPASVMGATKRLAELLVVRLAEAGPTRFSAVRFGNVLESAASVVPLFRRQIEEGGPVTVTHPEMRRYFMTIPEAVGLVLRAAYGDHGPLCVLEMGEPMRILDLARLMITMAGKVPEVDVPIEIVGLRPGEKLSEELVGEGEVEVRRVEGKIRVMEGPPPPRGLRRQLEQLGRAAAREDDAEVLVLLHRLLPDFAAVLQAPVR